MIKKWLRDNFSFHKNKLTYNPDHRMNVSFVFPVYSCRYISGVRSPALLSYQKSNVGMTVEFSNLPSRKIATLY